MKNSLIIVGFFVFGTMSGAYHVLPSILIENDFSIYALYVLMFLVGISIGADKKALEVIRSAKIKILLVPLSVIIGTLITKFAGKDYAVISVFSGIILTILVPFLVTFIL